MGTNKRGIINFMELQKYISQEYGLIRGIEINGISYLVGKDIAEKLDYQNITDALSRHVDEDDKLFFDKTHSGITTEFNYKQLGQRGGWLINESGFYSLVFGSELPTAKKFKHWVTAEVLPQIRKTGGYIPISKDDTNVDIMARSYAVAVKTIQEKDSIILELQECKDMCDKFIHSKGYVSLNKAAKGLKVGRNKMMRFLRDLSVLFMDGNDNLPYQKYIDSGYFTIDYETGHDGLVHSVTRVSTKGIVFIHRLYLKHYTVSPKAVA